MNTYQEDITDDYQQYSEQDYNVTIYAGEEPNITEFHAHSIILRCRSQYFRTALSSNWAEKENGMYILRKPNISGKIFQIILRYIYSGMVNFNKFEKIEYLEFLKATDELAFDKIRDYCIKIICQETEILFEIERFSTMPPRILELLLQQDKLELEEIDIWGYLIRWTYAQNPTIEFEPSKWTENDIEMMKDTIENLIPLIRFDNISYKDYFEKINPYEKLLSKKILRYYSNLNSESSELDSSIITQKDLFYSLFLNWINKKDNNQKSRKFLQYNFKLLLRGSRDGFDGNAFHYRCDNKGATIIIAKIKDSKQLVGGYNPLDWKGRNSKSTTDSFIFLFDDHKDVNSGKIGRVIHTKHAIRCYNNWGPIFGAYNSLAMSNNLAMNQNGEWSSIPPIPSSYPDLNIPNKFEIDDYEVFQVIKK
ncbi:hypothetical protein GLOIN_2v1789120 [Rhizophagus irregularis DAOM 181602=DAOM 197198]|uniref:Kelch-like protein 17 n=2 Tax=Rhizophagus irregularis TaxID=588596 RepID=A0A015JW57_RHIIW|nr:hypothetical protein GLOIN_2v1789120 [Rhizophagus irregularis DAOM 181602=DAOM 197198]EXX73782.1 hypothetical protein RirG_057290 [Rhizophagus irregularis DAOM 197198w]POG59436.1 hypothetical protein GLOIN_2v1789120 [Rhizophagus irregularis DAOM 181602=DAOM 197198]GBC21567.1 hypothetical protein GLOIN_2v1789120 [Rhizophagus irregularis DAOM 181602=DAOM 197198]|eukprot:XP_025166302.1 hypothetical protein GLOIN_2v1789120 [Rhizophagus irregularis DAOM 181602=DAOM 197198]